MLKPRVTSSCLVLWPTAQRYSGTGTWTVQHLRPNVTNIIRKGNLTVTSLQSHILTGQTVYNSYCSKSWSRIITAQTVGQEKRSHGENRDFNLSLSSWIQQCRMNQLHLPLTLDFIMWLKTLHQNKTRWILHILSLCSNSWFPQTPSFKTFKVFLLLLCKTENRP